MAHTDWVTSLASPLSRIELAAISRPLRTFFDDEHHIGPALSQVRNQAELPRLGVIEESTEGVAKVDTPQVDQMGSANADNLGVPDAPVS